MKLKKILKESSAPGYKDRKFGTALPTLASVQAAYEAKQAALAEETHDEEEEEVEESTKLSDMAENLKIEPKVANQMGSSLSHILTPKQHKNMLKILQKNKSNKTVAALLSTLEDKYSEAISIQVGNKPFFLYASYGRLRIGSGGKGAANWQGEDDSMLQKYLGEGKLGVVTEARIASNIQQKWESQGDILRDCRLFILQAAEAGGEDLARDLADTFKLLSNYAMGEYKKARR